VSSVTPHAVGDRERNERAVARRQLKTVLEKIAKGRGYHDPELQAQIAINKLFRRIDDHRSRRARFRRYDHFVGSRWTERERRERWLCYLIRLTHKKRTIGRRRGSVVGTKSSAIDNAAAVESVGQLSSVEQLAYKILRGGRRPKKETKHPIEKLAVKLAEAVQAEWLTAPPLHTAPRSNRKAQSFEMLKPPLTIKEVVSIAAPVIEEFVQERISARNLGSDALEHTIHFCMKAEWIAREVSASRDKAVSKKSLLEALSRMRNSVLRESALKITDNWNPEAK
jgi:hypothetical protein